MIIYRSVVLRMRNVSYKVVEKIITYSYILCTITFFENHAAYQIIGKNIV